MKRKRIGKRELARRLRMEYSSLARMMRPGYNPTLGMLERIAEALGCKIRDLFEEIKK